MSIYYAMCNTNQYLISFVFFYSQQPQLYSLCLNFITETCDVEGDVDIATDVFAIGFEEIVDLTAKNITSARQ